MAACEFTPGQRVYRVYVDPKTSELAPKLVGVKSPQAIRKVIQQWCDDARRGLVSGKR